MYVLNIDPETNRVLSVGKAIPGREYPGMVTVEEKPDDSDGKWASDYLYIDSTYIYDPEPRPEPPIVVSLDERVSQTEADIAFVAMMTDVELEG